MWTMRASMLSSVDGLASALRSTSSFPSSTVTGKRFRPAPSCGCGEPMIAFGPEALVTVLLPLPGAVAWFVGRRGEERIPAGLRVGAEVLQDDVAFLLPGHVTVEDRAPAADLGRQLRWPSASKRRVAEVQVAALAGAQRDAGQEQPTHHDDHRTVATTRARPAWLPDWATGLRSGSVRT